MPQFPCTRRPNRHEPVEVSQKQNGTDNKSVWKTTSFTLDTWIPNFDLDGWLCATIVRVDVAVVVVQRGATTDTKTGRSPSVD